MKQFAVLWNRATASAWKQWRPGRQRKLRVYRVGPGSCLFFLLAVFSGCLGQEGSPSPAETSRGDDVVPNDQLDIGRDALDLRSVADADAAAWHPEAKLILVATFEGQLPTSDPALNPWLAPYVGVEDAPMGDGRSRVWSFSYALDDSISQAATTACDEGAHAELREAHVVTINESGHILASYETRSDDEGAPNTGFLTDPVLSSSEAAALASNETSVNDWIRKASSVRTLLLSEWYAPEPVWAFLLELEGFDRRYVAVNALSGAVVVADGWPQPPC